MPYRTRVVDAELDELAKGAAAIALEGAKGVGKTATARQRVREVLELDNPQTLAVMAASPAALDAAQLPVLIDEWQRHPPVWDQVRRRVDSGAAPGSYLLTGSATPREAPAHSGAGRIIAVRMRPMTLAERDIATATVSLADLVSGSAREVSGRSRLTLRDYTDEILASGLPGIRPLTGRARRAALDGYLERIVQRDFPDLGIDVRRPNTLRAWLRAYAAATAESTSYQKIAEAAAQEVGSVPAKTTTQPYREALDNLFILDPIEGWSPGRNHLKKVGQSPKHHLVDPALAARLLGVDAAALLRGEAGSVDVPRDGTLLGKLFEGLVTQSVRVYAQGAEASVRHFRTRGGEREIDLIVERADQRVLAIEIKLDETIEDRHVRHLRWLQEHLGDDLIDCVVINTGQYAYRRPDGVAVVPAALLGP